MKLKSIGKGVMRPKSKNMIGLSKKYTYNIHHQTKKKKKMLTKFKIPNKKNHFKKILVPLDHSKNSKRALNEAIIIANQFDAVITCINIIPIVSFGNAYLIKKLMKDERKKAAKLLDKAKLLCQNYGIKYSSRIMKGDAGTIIMKITSSKKFNLIVVGSSGKGIAQEFFLGSVSNYIIQNSKIPVLVVK